MLLRYPASVLTFKDISLIWRDTREQGVVSSLAYYVKKGELLPLRRGIYAKDKDYLHAGSCFKPPQRPAADDARGNGCGAA